MESVVVVECVVVGVPEVVVAGVVAIVVDDDAVPGRHWE